MSSTNSSARILFVDDDPLARSAFAIQFRGLGYSVDVATSAHEALELVQSRSYPVVVTDLRMPGIDGLQMIERFRKLSPDTAFVVATGVSELDLAHDSFHDEAIVGVHAKPWVLESLKSSVERGLAWNQTKSSIDVSAASAVVIARDHRLATIISKELAADGFLVTAESTVEQATHALRAGPSLIVVEVSSLVPPRFTEMATLKKIARDSAIVVVGDDRARAVARQTIDLGASDYCLAHEIPSRAFHRAVRYAVNLRASAMRAADLERRDYITGLLRPASFQEAVAEELTSGAPFGLVLLGLDRLRAIKEDLGHAAGEIFLKHVSSRLRKKAGSAVLGRLVGDEIAVLVRGVQSEAEILDWGARLVHAVEDPIVLDGVEIAPMARAGVVMARGDDADSLLRQVGMALRIARQSARHRVHLLTEQIAPRSSRLSLEAELREALEKGRYVLHYQLQRDLKTGGIRGAEALLRMRRADGTLVPPGEFIPVLEETDMIIDVGAWVLEEASKKVAEWHRSGHRDIFVAVNLSARQFEQEGLVQTVLAATRKAGISPSSLELEITENLLMKDTELSNTTLRGLKEIGARIAIDDFGTGYSSLSYLQRFAVDVVKIDRAFVRTIGKGPAGGSIASAIIGLAHRLGLHVVAEGIETNEELEFLRAEQCDIGQGFLLGRPSESWSPSSVSAATRLAFVQ